MDADHALFKLSVLGDRKSLRSPRFRARVETRRQRRPAFFRANLPIGRMKARHIPNIISVFRILLVYPVVASILQKRFDWALTLFVVAGVSDALDGFLAKHFHWQSRLGSYIDPLADKLLLVSSYTC